MYKVYFGPPSDEYNRRQTRNTLAASKPSSYASGGSSRGSVISDSQPSHQFGRRYKGASIVSQRRSNEVLTPIHEHREDVCDAPKQFTSKGSLENTTIVEQNEEMTGELAAEHSEQAIELARCPKDEEATNVEQHEESTNADQDKGSKP